MGTISGNFIAVTDDIRRHLQFLAESGCQGFDCSGETLDILTTWRNKEVKVVPEARPKGRDSRETLEGIRRNLGDCRRCKLSKGRMNIVFGAGNPGARLLFVGDAPGYEADQTEDPFAGEAGQLLTKIIQAMKLTREQVYLCNLIKCRPPGNRDPEPDEIKTCATFLRRQIMGVKPAFICALGDIAAQFLLKTTEPVTRLRGRFHRYMGMKVMPTFHPAELLQHPEKKRQAWEDVQQLMRGLGIRV